MRHSKQSARLAWHSTPQVACPPGHRACDRFGSIPASPPVLRRSARNTAQDQLIERTLALVLTCSLLPIFALIAEAIRLVQTSAAAF